MKTLKKLFIILAIVLVAVLAFSPVKSIAAGDNLTLTVNGKVAGRTLSVYKLFNLRVDGENNTYYSWDGLASEAFFTSKGYDTIYKATEYLRTLGENSTELTNLAEEYYAYCNNSANAETLAGKTAKIGESKTAAADAQTVEFTGLDSGYYLVYDETTATATTAKSAAILSNLTKNSEVTIKVDDITVNKTVENATASIGEDAKFTVTSKVPAMIGYNTYTFNLVDTLSKGLTFNEDVKVTIDGKEYTDFTVAPVTNEDGTTVTIVFNNFINQKVNAGKEIIVKYSAKLNSMAATEKDNTNSVKAIYSNNPTTESTGESIPSVVHVYTYTIDITKKNSKGELLQGANFVLQLEDGTYATFDANGVYTGAVATIEEATLLTSDENGKVIFSGIKTGNYKLVETVAPEGYNKPDFTFDFTINQTLNADGTLQTASFDYTSDNTNNSAKGYIADATNTSASFVISILNAKEGLLPSTGGMGTTIFTIIGLVVMALVVVAFIIRNKKQD